MRAAFLSLDDALTEQVRLIGRANGADACTIEARDIGAALRLWGRQAALTALAARIRDRLPASSGSRLVFAGSGDFHHATPTLIARAVETTPGPVTVIHFDNHPDWVRFSNGLHCGSWVGAASRLTGVAHVITLGVCSADIGRRRMRQADMSLILSGRLTLFPYRSPDGDTTMTLGDRCLPTIESVGLTAFLDRLLEEISTDAVYITIDKDVLCEGDAITNWDQGRMEIEEMLAILTAVMERHRVIGADVVGDWSKPVYGGGIVNAMMKRGEALLDQPWSRPDGGDGINEAVNVKLLNLFAEAA